MVGAHSEDRVRNTPCAHNPDEEQRAKRRVRRDVEPPEVRRFLRQELLRMVGHSWWNRPRVYRHDLAGDAEESPRTREGRVAAATLEQEMGRRSVAAAIRPIKEGHPPEKRSATDPRARQGKPPGR